MVLLPGFYCIDTKPWRGTPKHGEIWKTIPDDPWEEPARIYIVGEKDGWVKFQRTTPTGLASPETAMKWRITKNYIKE